MSKERPKAPASCGGVTSFSGNQWEFCPVVHAPPRGLGRLGWSRPAIFFYEASKVTLEMG